MTARVKISQIICTCQCISRALKSQTLSNLMCSKYIDRSTWVERLWLVKALSCIVEGWSKWQSKPVKNGPVCTVGSTVENRQLLATKVQSEGILRDVIVGGSEKNRLFKSAYSDHLPNVKVKRQYSCKWYLYQYTENCTWLVFGTCIYDPFISALICNKYIKSIKNVQVLHNGIISQDDWCLYKLLL